MFKLATFDLDGTVVGANGQVSQPVQEAIAALRSRGVRIAIATGRPEFATRDIASAIGADAPSLYFSGALIAHPRGGASLAVLPLSRETIDEVVSRARQARLYLEAYTSTGYFIENPNPLAELHATYLHRQPEVQNFGRLFDEEPILKLLTIAENAEEEQRFTDVMQGVSGVSLQQSRGPAHPHIVFGNFTSIAATRETGFARMTEALGVDTSEVIAFGDAPADIPFLSLAGCGVAMGDAPEEVKRAAKMTTLSVAEDGVAHALRELGLIEMGGAK